MKLVKSFLFISFLIFPFSTFADALTGLSVSISSSGDVPEVSISCVTGNNYTLSLVSDMLSHNFGALERKYCSEGLITFSAFNLNSLLISNAGGPEWWPYFRAPFSYIIKNTTGDYLSACNQSSCSLSNLSGAFNFYDQTVYLTSNTYWPTVAAGPVFNTSNYEAYAIWSNSANGDGSLNYVALPTYSSVLFLPGLKASRLYKTGIINCSVNCEDQLWEPNWDTDVEALFMNPDGTSMDESIYTRDVMDEAFGTLNIYKSFLDNLEEMKSIDGTIADYSAVPYDWRLSLEDIITKGKKTGENISYIGDSDEPYIMSELVRLASSSDNGKVTIVAHSNGGLVAKALLKKLADTNNPLLDKVDKLILVAVPQLGTPSAITAMLHGDKQGIPVIASELTARRLGENLPGGYHLLPSQKYFEHIDNPVISFDESLAEWGLRFGESVNTKESLRNFLTDNFERVESGSENLKTPSHLRDDLLDDAEVVHDSLDVWTPPSTLGVVEIAGWGIPTTVKGVEYYEDKGKVKFNPLFTVDGDGTVVTPSALWTNDVTANTTEYWVNLEEYNKNNYDLKHKDILEVGQVRSLIMDIILGNSSNLLPAYLSTSAPASDQVNRLVYSLHSPLTLDIYDSLGNHTGVSTTTGEIEEQIPGTYFIQFGDEKYIFTDSGTPFTISMSGYDTGTFTFKIEQLQGDNTVSSVEFKDIPTTFNTKVSMNITNDIQTLSSLNVDSDNDGSPDIRLLPIIDGIVTYTPLVSVPSTVTTLVVSNGPPIMQVVAHIATSTTEYESSDSTTFIQAEVATTTLSVVVPLINETNQKPKKATQKPKTVVHTQVKKVVPKDNQSQVAQVVSSDSLYSFTFVGFIKKFSGWITNVLK